MVHHLAGDAVAREVHGAEARHPGQRLRELQRGVAEDVVVREHELLQRGEARQRLEERQALCPLGALSALGALGALGVRLPVAASDRPRRLL